MLLQTVDLGLAVEAMDLAGFEVHSGKESKQGEKKEKKNKMFSWS